MERVQFQIRRYQKQQLQIITTTKMKLENKLPQTLPTKSDKLKIIIRMRPILSQQDPTQFVKLADDNTLQIKRPNNMTYMKFNNILPPDSTQKDVFVLLQDSIKNFINGINVTIFAYGQTGAGKTYSIIGLYSASDSYQNLFNFLSSKQRGILSRSLQSIMKYIMKRNQYKISVSFYEIYNEKIYDLYNHTMNPLHIRQSKNGQITIADLFNLQINTMQDAIKFLMTGLKNRSTRSTHGNVQSSRSHSIFQINLTKYSQNNKQIINSILRIVDLAGSEKFKIPHDLSVNQKQIRVQELTSINGSLSSLGHCISVMIQKSRTHIPFRNSKLTRILSDSLLGKGKMRFIICISPSLTTQAQTFSTLQFASRAKKAILLRQCSPSTISLKTDNSNKQQIIQLTKQLQKQRQKIKILQNKYCNIANIQLFTQKLKQNVKLIKQNQILIKKIQQYKKQKFNNSSSSTTRTNRLKSFNNKSQIIMNQSKENVDSYFYDLEKDQESQNNNTKNSQFQRKVIRFLQACSPTQRSSVQIKSYKYNKNNKLYKIDDADSRLRLHTQNLYNKSTSHNNSIFSQQNLHKKYNNLQITKKHQTSHSMQPNYLRQDKQNKKKKNLNNINKNRKLSISFLKSYKNSLDNNKSQSLIEYNNNNKKNVQILKKLQNNSIVSFLSLMKK